MVGRALGTTGLGLALLATACGGGAKTPAAARQPRAGGTKTASGPTSCARPSSPTPSGPVIRVRGQDRDETAIAISQSQFPGPDHPGQAAAVVLASDANYPDALAGTPLAAAKDAPLLLTGPSSLNPAVADEITRVAPKGATVYLLGGPGALAPSVEAKVQALGDIPQRIAGPDRYATAVAIAGVLGDPRKILEASGSAFADALSAGAAARNRGGPNHTVPGAVLLTNGGTQAPETAAYLAAHRGDTRTVVGGPAAAADPDATPLVGSDRYATAVVVAQHLFAVPDPAHPGQQLVPSDLEFASGVTFADALAGSADTNGSPMLLVPPCGPLPSSVADYLASTHPKAAQGAALSSAGRVGGVLYGGPRAVGDDVLRLLEEAWT